MDWIKIIDEKFDFDIYAWFNLTLKCMEIRELI